MIRRKISLQFLFVWFLFQSLSIFSFRIFHLESRRWKGKRLYSNPEDFSSAITETPLIERTFNPIDPLSEIYGPDETSSNSLKEIGHKLAEIAHSISPLIPFTLLCAIGFGVFADYAYNYARSQSYLIELFSGIPKSVTEIVEIDAIDPKTIFYLPKNSSYIALNLQIIDSPRDQTLLSGQREREMKLYETLLDQSIAQANLAPSSSSSATTTGLITGKARFRSSELASRSADCVISVNAFERLQRRLLQKYQDQTPAVQAKLLEEEQLALMREIDRILRPGGYFLFYEAVKDPESSSSSLFLQRLLRYFPRELETTASAPIGGQSVPPPSSTSRSNRKEKNGFMRKKQQMMIKSKKEEEEEEDQLVIETEKDMKKKPGLVYQIRQTLPWRKYLLGIGIKP